MRGITGTLGFHKAGESAQRGEGCCCNTAYYFSVETSVGSRSRDGQGGLVVVDRKTKNKQLFRDEMKLK